MIEIWQNKQTEAPSIQVGSITIDLGRETPAQAELFRLVMNHPDADAGASVRAPLTEEIQRAFLSVLAEHTEVFLPKKKMPHSVEVQVDRS